MGFSADASSLRRAGKKLREVDASLYREVQRALRVEGNRIAARAGVNASWSKQIPGSFKVTVSGVNAVKIRATARNAGPLEHAGAQGVFRHPVFGDRENWVDQPARPFLHPAALAHLDESTEALRSALQVHVDTLMEEFF